MAFRISRTSARKVVPDWESWRRSACRRCQAHLAVRKASADVARHAGNRVRCNEPLAQGGFGGLHEDPVELRVCCRQLLVQGAGCDAYAVLRLLEAHTLPEYASELAESPGLGALELHLQRKRGVAHDVANPGNPHRCLGVHELRARPE
jgi:hypothetical protein